jgi:uncharacterized protein YciI
MSESPGYQKSGNEVRPILMTVNCQAIKQNQRVLKRTRQADYPWISEYTNWKKLLVVGREKRKYPAGLFTVCAVHQEHSETE